MASLELKEAYGLFEDSSDSEDESKKSANMHISASIGGSVRTDNYSPMHELPDDANQVQYECCEPVLWKHRPPEYMGPALFSEAIDVGGCRGYTANQDIFPGALIMIESAFIGWPKKRETDNLFIDTLKMILQDEKNYQDWMECISHVYPVYLEDLPADIYRAGLEKYQDEIARLDTNVSFEKMLQIVFAMQSNAFSSGIFLHCSIFNHSCEPNCIKFNPSSEKPTSEVRAARLIRKGEPLTISYLHPLEQSRTARQEQLNAQFGFTCHCPECEKIDEQDIKFSEIEKQIPKAENLLKAKCPSQSLAYALEIFADALEILPHDAMQLIRIHKLVANSTAELLKNENEQFLEHAILFLRSSYELYELQKKYLNKDHLDLAGTLNDISQGIQILLSYSPETLYAEFDEWGTFRSASIAENEFRKEHYRIRRLYE